MNYWEKKFRDNSAEFAGDFGGYLSPGADDPTADVADGHIDTTAFVKTPITLTKTRTLGDGTPAPAEGSGGILETAENLPLIGPSIKAAELVAQAPAVWTTQILPQIADTAAQTLQNPPGVGLSILPKHFWWYVFGAAALGFWLLPKALSAGGAAAMKYGKYALL